MSVYDLIQSCNKHATKDKADPTHIAKTLSADIIKEKDNATMHKILIRICHENDLTGLWGKSFKDNLLAFKVCLYASADTGQSNKQMNTNVQSNFNGSNTFGTMKINSRQEWFEPMRVDYSARSGGIIRIFSIFFNMKVCCVFSLESPHRGDSNEYTQYTIFNIK